VGGSSAQEKSATASEGHTLERSPSVAILPRAARSWKSSATARRSRSDLAAFPFVSGRVARMRSQKARRSGRASARSRHATLAHPRRDALDPPFLRAPVGRGQKRAMENRLPRRARPDKRTVVPRGSRWDHGPRHLRRREREERSLRRSLVAIVLAGASLMAIGSAQAGPLWW
jgi:hypothetical protein